MIRPIDPSSEVELLSGSDPIAVYRCRRGGLQLRVGMLTLTLTTEQFWKLMTCVGEASVRLLVREVVDGLVRDEQTRSGVVEASARSGPSPIAR
jgi:hypothetical protein